MPRDKGRMVKLISFLTCQLVVGKFTKVIIYLSSLPTLTTLPSLHINQMMSPEKKGVTDIGNKKIQARFEMLSLNTMESAISTSDEYVNTSKRRIIEKRC